MCTELAEANSKVFSIPRVKKHETKEARNHGVIGYSESAMLTCVFLF